MDTPKNTADPMEGTARQSCSEILRSKARRLRDEAHEMEILADRLQHLSRETDGFLWRQLVQRV